MDERKVINNVADKNAEALEIEGLEDYLPADLVNDPEDKKRKNLKI